MKKAVILFFLLIFGACGGGPTADQIAASRLRAFQESLRAKDGMRLMGILTESSRRFVPALLRKTPGALPPVLLSAKREDSRIEALVRDPNPGATVSEGIYILAKEDGEWRIDLVATGGANSREKALPGPSTRIVPARISRKRMEEARRLFEASYKRSSGSK